MTFEFDPKDEDPHGLCRHEIQSLQDTVAALQAQIEFSERYRRDFIQAYELSGDPHWGDIATVVFHKFEKLQSDLERK